MQFSIPDLVAPLRILITITALICFLCFVFAFKRGALESKNLQKLFFNRLYVWGFFAATVALVFTHSSLIENPGQYLPFGVAVGFLLAILSLFWQPAITTFDSLSDSDIQLLMSFRAIFGAFLYAGAGLYLFPPMFAIFAGTGDLVAGWIAMISKNTRTWRWTMHGWGALDLIDVAILGTFVVRPWLMETGSLGPSLLLPWLAVPLLFALNLHGLRKLLTQTNHSDLAIPV